MVYIRASRQDYDTWAQMGCRNWSYDKVLPVFRDLESNQRLSGEYHGVGGELTVSDRAYGHPLSWAFIRAAQEVGIPYNEDFNGSRQEGVGFYQTTTSKGRRRSAAEAFLRKAEARPNLTIRTATRVHKVEFDGNRATGVVLDDGSIVKVKREVILTAELLPRPRSCSSPASGRVHICASTASTSSPICLASARTIRTISKLPFSARSRIRSRSSARTRACAPYRTCCNTC